MKSFLVKESEELHPAEAIVARMIIRQNMAFRSAEDPDLVRLLHKAYPNFQGLKRDRLRESVIPTLAANLLQPLVKILRASFFSITTDGWEKTSETPAFIRLFSPEWLFLCI